MLRSGGGGSSGGGGGGSTDLSVTRTTTKVTVQSSTGTSADIATADGTHAGVLTASDKSKLDGIEAGAQVNPSSLPPNGSASGDLSGTYPSPTVAKLNGKAAALFQPYAFGSL